MKKKILVVDDSPLVLAMVEDMLQDLNYEITTASNGKEACKAIENSRFNLVLTDLNMPGMDGIEFAQQAKASETCKFVPIVMLSSEDDAERISEAKQMGISTFLKKPIKETKLKTLLQMILGG